MTDEHLNIALGLTERHYPAAFAPSDTPCPLSSAEEAAASAVIRWLHQMHDRSLVTDILVRATLQNVDDAIGALSRGALCSYLKEDGNLCLRGTCPATWNVPLCSTHFRIVETAVLTENRDAAREAAAVAANVIRSAGPVDQSPRAVYYIQRSKHDRAIKIGTTWHLMQRVATIRSDLREPVELLTTHGGGRPAEKVQHRNFAHLRVYGEWFRPEPDLLAHIEHVKARNAARDAAP